MPFIVTGRISERCTMFAQVDADGDVIWKPSKTAATTFDESEADAIAASINQYGSDIADVVGVRNTVESPCQ